MELNGVIRQGDRPVASPVVRAPETAGTAAQKPAPRTEREDAPKSENTRSRHALDVLAENRAQHARGGTRLRIDDATDKVVAQIVNTNNEVIKQIPPEAALRVAARFRDLVGVLFDEQI